MTDERRGAATSRELSAEQFRKRNSRQSEADYWDDANAEGYAHAVRQNLLPRVNETLITCNKELFRLRSEVASLTAERDALLRNWKEQAKSDQSVIKQVGAERDALKEALRRFGNYTADQISALKGEQK